MSKAQQLEVIKNDIRVPGCTFSATGLSLEVVDEQTLLHAGVFLAQVEGCRSWWWGDFLLAYCEFRLSMESDSLQSEAKNDPAMRVRLFRRYTAEREDIAKVELKTLHEWRDTCDFYEPTRRRAKLLNSHHVEAMYGSDGDKAVADDWLQKAIDNNWSKSQLRAAIRTAAQAGAEPSEPMPQVTQQELFACARWSRTVIKRVPDMDRNEAQQLLADLQPIVALASQLAAKLAAETKESIAA